MASTFPVNAAPNPSFLVGRNQNDSANVRPTYGATDAVDDKSGPIGPREITPSGSRATPLRAPHSTLVQLAQYHRRPPTFRQSVLAFGELLRDNADYRNSVVARCCNMAGSGLINGALTSLLIGANPSRNITRLVLNHSLLGIVQMVGLYARNIFRDQARLAARPDPELAIPAAHDEAPQSVGAQNDPIQVRQDAIGKLRYTTYIDIGVTALGLGAVWGLKAGLSSGTPLFLVLFGLQAARSVLQSFENGYIDAIKSQLRDPLAQYIVDKRIPNVVNCSELMVAANLNMLGLAGTQLLALSLAPAYKEIFLAATALVGAAIAAGGKLYLVSFAQRQGQ